MARKSKSQAHGEEVIPTKLGSEMKVHPAAAIFPMLEDEELASLAESIGRRGLRHPIMLWENGSDAVLIDGRNRFRACELTGVEPQFEHFQGSEEDICDYIADVNLERRDLKKSQKLMLLATLYPVAQRHKQKGLDEAISQRLGNVSKSLKTAQNRLGIARQILKYDPELAKKVLNGYMELDKAHALALEKQRENESEESQLAELRQMAPEIAELVPDSLTLSQAWAAYQQKVEEESERQKIRCQSAHKLITETAHHLWTLGTGTVTRDEFPLVMEDEEFLKAIDGNVMGYGLGLIWEHVDENALRAGLDHLLEMINTIKESKYGQEAHAE